MTWQTRQLTTYQKGSTAVRYVYGADGLRTRKVVDGKTSEYFYANGRLFCEIRDGKPLYFFYDAYGHLIAVQYFLDATTFALYYAATNAAGDVLGLYTGNGNQVVWYEYDAWGNATITDTTGLKIGTVNPIRYRGIAVKALMIFCLPLIFGTEAIWLAPFVTELVTFTAAIALSKTSKLVY